MKKTDIYISFFNLENFFVFINVKQYKLYDFIQHRNT